MWKPEGTKIARSPHHLDVIRNNYLMDLFLKSDCDVLARMDVDQEYPEDYITKLLPLVEKHKVVGPLIYDRWQVNDYAPLMFHDRFNWYDIADKSGVINVPYAHTNLLYAREVIEKAEKPLFYRQVGKDGISLENQVDFDVQDKIKDAGYDIFINLDVVVKHITEIGVDNVLHEKWREVNDISYCRNG